MSTERDEYPTDFGQQVIVASDDGWRGWITPVLGGLAMGAYLLSLMVGR